MSEVIVYHYDRDDNIFYSKSVARKDPENGSPLIPAHATLVESPSLEEFEAAVFNTETEKWSIVKDYRKAIFFNKQTKAKAEFVLGDNPDLNIVTDRPPVGDVIWDDTANDWVIDIVTVREKQKEVVNNGCHLDIVSGFKSSALGDEHVYQSDRDDQLNLIGSVATGVDVLFKCADGAGVSGFRGHTVAQIKIVIGDGAIRKLLFLKEANRLKNLIDDATTVEDIEEIGWAGID